MREILFRGKRVDNGEWVEGYGFADEGYFGKIFFYHDTFTDEEGEEYLFYDNVRVHTDTVGQYTGLQDKNGKKIFEGDIVKFEFPSDKLMDLFVVNGKFSFTGVASMEDQFYTLDKKNEHGGVDSISMWQMRAKRDYHSGVIEILGNIHDNPELLEVK